MKKLNTMEMRNVEGGAYYCNTCGKKFSFKWTAGYHILFYGHRSFRYDWRF